jgi:hypothetical protein
MLACFGITVDGSLRARTGFKPSKLHMHNDTLGAPGVAVYATRHICLNARVYDYEAAFLPPEPRNQSDARKRPDKDKWIEAEEKELTTLWDMGTFVLTDALPDHDPLPLQFVYKLKVKDGDFDNCINKARLVMRGDLQYQHEHGDTYAPTAKLWVVRTMTALAAQQGFMMKKFDLTGAFLVADMDRPLYVNIPGYKVPKGKALLLKKALYGGRSSGALYAKEISSWLRDYGFIPTTVDPTLYKYTRGDKVIYVSLYVDDGACFTNDEELYQEFIKALSTKYKLSDQADLEWHLGMKFTRDLEAGTVAMDQRAYIEHVLKRFNMSDCRVKPTPLPAGITLSADDCPKYPIREDVKMYQQLIGSLMYISCGTRPDIAYAVNACAQFMKSPGQTHIAAAKHIL